MSSELQQVYNSILLPGREEEARVLMLSLIARQHCVLIGPPGTAKSLLISRLARMFNVQYFEYLLTKFTQPEELLGYPNIKVLREQGEYQLITRNRLPEAKLAFIDEIFKGSSAILNALLQILNERKFFDGQKVIKVPLWTAMGASNEVPEEPELQALWDRFLFRHWVYYISRDRWEELLTTYWAVHKSKAVQNSFDFKIIEEAHNKLWNVNVFTMTNKLLQIFAKLEDSHGIVISDRRKGRCLIALASNAILNDRDVVLPEDFLVLKYVIPENEDQVKTVEQVIIDIIGEDLKVKQELSSAIQQLQGFIEELENASDFDEAIRIAERAKFVGDVLSKYSNYKDFEEYQKLKQLSEEFSKVLAKKIVSP